ncbi:hypothetical protein UlMin_018638 [Ulmus minor]
MKILEAVALTNFEVVNFLRSILVYDYLVEIAACNLTTENIDEFLEKSKTYVLAKAEMLNIINVRPSTAVEIFSPTWRARKHLCL